MRILLDTHLLLWWMANHTSLSRNAPALIADPGNTIFISVVSLWEIWLKSSLGKLRVPPDVEDKLAAEFFESLPLMPSHARHVALLRGITATVRPRVSRPSEIRGLDFSDGG